MISRIQPARLNSIRLIRRFVATRTTIKASSSQTTKETTTPFYGAPRPASTSPSFLQRLALATHSATTAFADPTRADAVAALGEVTGHVSLTQMYDRMMSDPTGQRILRDQPLVSNSTIDMDDLFQQLKRARESNKGEELTFGQAYAAFMEEHGYDPDERSEVKYITDPELAYIMLRYRQCHDYWHALTGLPPTVLGELGLKWLELLQTGLPVAALSATVGSLRLNAQERDILNNQYLPWAVRMSNQSDYLLNVYYEEEFDTPLSELRKRIGIEAAPAVENDIETANADTV